MLMALIVFLVGCLVLAVVVYVVHLIMGMLELPPPIRQIAMLIIGLIGLIIVIVLAVNVFRGGSISL